MKQTGKHLIFYDGTCGLCHKTVQFILSQDKKEDFLFAPLEGETARQILPDPEKETIILCENFQSSREDLTKGKGSLRILWLLGGIWTLPGLLSFLPSPFFDWVYRNIAKHRLEWFERKSCNIPKNSDTSRFLP